MKKAVWLSVIVGTVLTVAVVAMAMSLLKSTNGEPSPVAGSESGSETAQPADIPPRPDCPAGPVAGVELDCLGGAASGKPADQGITVVNMWAWWCEPCRKELPLLDTVAAQHPEWTVVGVHADKNPGHGAALLDDLGVAMPSYQDNDNLFAGTLGLPGVIPITLVLRDGAVVGRHITPFTSAADIEAAVKESVG